MARGSVRLWRLGVAAALIGLGSWSSALALTATTSFQVTARVRPVCQISAATLDFGNYDSLQIDHDGTITVTCSKTTTYNVGLDAGTSAGATVTTRKMAGPNSAFLNYSLFKDAAHTSNWGNTVGTDTVAGVGNGAAQTLTVYGRLPANQFVEPSSYVDTITATITF